MQGIHLRKYGVATTIDFDVYGITGVDLNGAWVPAQVDCEVSKNEGTSTMCTNTAADIGATFSIVLTATEMEAARIVLKIVDAATKVILDKVVIIETYGHASAQHNLEDAGETVISGAAATGTLSTTSMTTNLTIPANDQYNGRIIIFRSDTTTAALRGQATDITDTVTTNGQLTFTALTDAPVDGDTFVIV